MLYLRYSAFRAGVFLLLLFMFYSADRTCSAQAESGSEVRGRVTFSNTRMPIPAASVTIVQLRRSTMTDANGQYSFVGIPPGSYDVVSHMHDLSGPSKKIHVVSGEDVTVNLELSLSPLKYEVTVTSTGREVSAFDAFQAVTTVDSVRLSERSSFGLGDVVGSEPGVHKRSFGPGSSRPVVRGFDGDRVLILNDGLSTGTLSAQSGEHAEPIDSAHLDRIEIVKGPATLLYGSNAIGGVVNMVTEHHLLHEQSHPGFRGQLTAIGGTNNNQAAGHVSAEYGRKNWLVWSSGSRQVTGDYSSAAGRVENSKTRMTSGSAGFGWFSDRPFFNLSYAFNEGRLGIPFAGEFHHHHHEEEGEEDSEDHEDHEEEAAASVDETFTWQNVRFNGGMRGMHSFFEEFKVSANFSRWMHKELENEETATAFDNKLFNLRATAEQRKYKLLTGTSGFQLFHRDYAAEGEEALSPPATGNGLALFTLQEIDLKAARLQFGGRVDHTAYKPSGLSSRSFTGLSGAAGIHIPLREDTAFVANYTHSYRAPAIEELYNYGPHIGNLAYEIGDPNLKREAADGVDLSLRYENPQFNAEANFYYYSIRDFVYLRLTGELEHGLRVAEFTQDDARFLGGELLMNVALHRNLWLESGLDIVNAVLTRSGDPLPRIPPLRGKLGLDARWRGISFRPEVVMAGPQDRLYPTETRTAGYAVVNMAASYTLVRSNLMHVVSAGVYNVGDALYRNHLSFIKDLAPEMGRSARFTYSLRFF
ncbi:MAG: TonB-dependent receptor [Acidobacteriota bacterium]|nr:TonB-dependent receptor [Acidobacteriota bacterium]